MWRSLCPQYNPHPMEDESLWINVSTSLSSSAIILSSDHLIDAHLIAFLPFRLSVSPLSHTSVFCDHLQNEIPVSSLCLRVSLK